VELLKRGTKGGKRFAALALRDLACVDPAAARAIASEGAVEALLALMWRGKDKDKEAAVGALRSLTCSCLDTRRAIVQAGGVVEPLIALVTSGTGVYFLTDCTKGTLY
jgi:hypothetical protein